MKIDPLAIVQTIERYLVVRGYGGKRVNSKEDSEEDIDAAVIISMGGLNHKVQFLIGKHVLPFNMIVYQAIRRYLPLVNDQYERDTVRKRLLEAPAFGHTIYYPPVVEDSNSASKSGQSSSSRKNSKNLNKKKRALETGIMDLTYKMLPDVDASLDTLCMLRNINALNRHWAKLYLSVPKSLIIP